jgi:hypothetical protein
MGSLRRWAALRPSGRTSDIKISSALALLTQVSDNLLLGVGGLT